MLARNSSAKQRYSARCKPANGRLRASGQIEYIILLRFGDLLIVNCDKARVRGARSVSQQWGPSGGYPLPPNCAASICQLVRHSAAPKVAIWLKGSMCPWLASNLCRVTSKTYLIFKQFTEANGVGKSIYWMLLHSLVDVIPSIGALILYW